MFVARKQELNWLEKQSRLSRLVFINGVRGVGKSSFLATWIRQKERKFQWLTLDRLRDLSHSLGHPDKSPERALELASQNWHNLDVVVWDEAHLLAPSAQKALFSFLKNSPFLPLQIFLSDEALSLEVGAAQLQMQPFSKEQVQEYLQVAFDREATEEEVTNAIKLSGGVPLLLQILSCDGAIKENAKQQVLEHLGIEERSLLVKASALGRTFHAQELGDIDAAALQSLQRKFLLDSVPSSHDLYIVPSYVRSLCLNAIDVQELKSVYAELCKRATDPFEALFFALRADMDSAVDELAANIPFDRVEHLRREDLQDFANLVAEFRKRSQKNELHSSVARLEIRALWFLGQRGAAVEAAESIRLTFGEKLSQELVLEIVQIFNRASRAEEARKLAEISMKFADPYHAAALRLEIGSSWIAVDRNTARTILNEALKLAQRLTVTSQQEIPLRLVQAHCHFQIARCFDMEENFTFALPEYEKALGVFEQCERPYFAAVTLLNCAWIYLKEHRWVDLKKVQARLLGLAERYGYTYVAAGVELIEAIEARLGLEHGKALRKIESSLKRLGASAPLIAIIDSQVELIRILLAMGMRKQAELAYKKLKVSVQDAPEFHKSRVKDLQYEVFGVAAAQEKLLEHVNAGSEISEALQFMLARRGLTELPNNAEKSRIGRLSGLEEKLIHCFDLQDEQGAWLAIGRMDAILREVNDASIERVALLLLQASLAQNANLEEKVIEVERELARLSADAEILAPLHAWLESLKGGKQLRPQEFDSWKKAPIGDQERWQRWLKFVFPLAEKPWLVITNGATEYADEPVLDSKAKLFVLEHLGEVRFRGKAKKEFIRRHSLRRILCLLLENGLDGVSKHTIAATVWGEAYNPETHDTRTYTAIQRLRAIFSMPSAIQNWQSGYRWNPELDFVLVRPNQKQKKSDTRCQSLILQTLESFSGGAKSGVGRSELVEITKTSEATVKRELAKLLSSAKIRRSGSGRSVVYSLYNSRASQAS